MSSEFTQAVQALSGNLHFEAIRQHYTEQLDSMNLKTMNMTGEELLIANGKRSAVHKFLNDTSPESAGRYANTEKGG